MLYQCKSCLNIKSDNIICLWAKFLIQVDSIIFYDQIIYLIHNFKGYIMIII